MKYSISDIANLLGISIVTVRNYEKCGLIEPERNEQNNYRQYNAIDMNLIRRARSYMSYGFSLNDATDMLKSDDLLTLAEHLERIEPEIEKRMMREYQLLSFVRQHAAYLKRLSVSCGECTIEMSPAFYGFTYREGIHILEDEELHRMTRRWNDIRPFAETFQVFLRACFEDGKMRNHTGLCIEAQYAALFDIHEDQYVRYYPSRKSVHAIVGYTFEPDIDYSDFEFRFAADWIRERNLKIVGDAVGRVLHTSKSTGSWLHYIEIWVPVE